MKLNLPQGGMSPVRLSFPCQPSPKIEVNFKKEQISCRKRIALLFLVQATPQGAL